MKNRTVYDAITFHKTNISRRISNEIDMLDVLVELNDVAADLTGAQIEVVKNREAALNKKVKSHKQARKEYFEKLKNDEKQWKAEQKLREKAKSADNELFVLTQKFNNNM